VCHDDFTLSLLEIIKAVENNSDNIIELLQINADLLEPNCFNQTLVAAVSNDNHHSVRKMIVKGANNIEECLRKSQDDHKPHARAMLLLGRLQWRGTAILS